MADYFVDPEGLVHVASVDGSKVGQVPEQEALRLFEAGEAVPVADGQEQAAADRALRMAETQRRLDEEMPDLASFASSAGNAMAIGIPHAVMRALGHGDVLEEMARQNPTATAVGDVAGAVTGAIAGPAGLLGRVAASGAKSVGAGMITRTLAQVGAESAAMGTGSALTEYALTGESENIASSALKHTAINAAIGGTAVLGILGAGHLYKAARSASGKTDALAKAAGLESTAAAKAKDASKLEADVSKAAKLGDKAAEKIDAAKIGVFESETRLAAADQKWRGLVDDLSTGSAYEDLTMKAETLDGIADTVSKGVLQAEARVMAARTAHEAKLRALADVEALIPEKMAAIQAELATRARAEAKLLDLGAAESHELLSAATAGPEQFALISQVKKTVKAVPRMSKNQAAAVRASFPSRHGVSFEEAQRLVLASEKIEKAHAVTRNIRHARESAGLPVTGAEFEKRFAELAGRMDLEGAESLARKMADAGQRRLTTGRHVASDKRINKLFSGKAGTPQEILADANRVFEAATGETLEAAAALDDVVDLYAAGRTLRGSESRLAKAREVFPADKIQAAISAEQVAATRLAGHEAGLGAAKARHAGAVKNAEASRQVAEMRLGEASKKLASLEDEVAASAAEVEKLASQHAEAVAEATRIEEAARAARAEAEAMTDGALRRAIEAAKGLGTGTRRTIGAGIGFLAGGPAGAVLSYIAAPLVHKGVVLGIQAAGKAGVRASGAAAALGTTGTVGAYAIDRAVAALNGEDIATIARQVHNLSPEEISRRISEIDDGPEAQDYAQGVVATLQFLKEHLPAPPPGAGREWQPPASHLGSARRALDAAMYPQSVSGRVVNGAATKEDMRLIETREPETMAQIVATGAVLKRMNSGRKVAHAVDLISGDRRRVVSIQSMYQQQPAPQAAGKPPNLSQNQVTKLGAALGAGKR